ncbi:MAG: biotin--[acetyl-CoA-carboxylase] ligase [Puniceicoccales bacterium]|jgi:BirA family biotin operon repressor/biotin-[acetyl-CoA-carboxylase] ligase|nr:biotin--[acetyl-CoA-carboxylase] ligase [Puniceicoccales bacterium]
MQIFRLENIDSTNSHAFELAEKSQPSMPFMVIAKSQTAGRGQFHRKWYSSDDKNLYLSVAFKPKKAPANFSNFSLKFAELVAERLSNKFSINFTIKYPNDIYFNGKKLAGILTETKILGNEIMVAVSGIGINVNADITTYPPGIRETATSIYALLNHQVDLSMIEKLVIDVLAKLIS